MTGPGIHPLARADVILLALMLAGVGVTVAAIAAGEQLRRARRQTRDELAIDRAYIHRLEDALREVETDVRGRVDRVFRGAVDGAPEVLPVPPA